MDSQLLRGNNIYFDSKSVQLLALIALQLLCATNGVFAYYWKGKKMIIKLKNDDVAFTLEIADLGNPGEITYLNDDSALWKISLKGNYINYSADGVINSNEVLGLRDLLNLFIQGEFKENRSMVFQFPDLEFKLIPAKRHYTGDRPFIIYTDGYCDEDIYLGLVVRFRLENEKEIITPAYDFTMHFEREEITALYTYLRYVTGEIDENDETVKKYVNAGMFLQ